MTRPHWPVLELVTRRLANRPSEAAAIALALAAGAAMMGIGSIVGALAADRSVRAQVAELPPSERSLQVTYRTSSDLDSRRLGAAAARALNSFRTISAPSVRIHVWDPVSPADERGFRLVQVDRPGLGLVLSGGRSPRRCTHSLCEVVSLDRSLALGRVLALRETGGTSLRMRIVGRGALAPGAAAHGDVVRERALVLPRGGSRTAAELLRDRASLVVLSASLRPDAVRGRDLAALIERLRRTAVRLQRIDPSLRLEAPIDALGSVARRVEVSQRRLLIVAGQSAALILAFAAFVATARRVDEQLRRRQLVDLAAGRRQVFRARVGEVAIPGAIGIALAVLVLLSVAGIIALRRGDDAAFVARAVPVRTLAAMVGVGVAGVALIIGSAQPQRPRARLQPLELAGVAALLVIVWQAATTSGLDADAIAAGHSGSALLLLLPALAVFASCVALLRLLPILLGLLERTARRASAAVRLAAVHTARDPRHAAAATTFLAVAIGTAIFSLNYRSTLAAQATAAADFQAGVSWRVSERDDRGLPSVAPLARFGAITDERPTPVLRLQANVLEPGDIGADAVPITVLGLPADRLSALRGWRSDFAETSRREIARRLMSRRTTIGGVDLSPGATALRVWVRGDPELPRRVVVDLLTPGLQFQYVPLGRIGRGWSRLEARLPPSARTRIVGLDFPVDRSVRPERLDEGVIELAGLEQYDRRGWSRVEGIDDWVATPSPGRAAFVLPVALRGGFVPDGLRLDINGATAVHLRAPAGLPPALPALVGAPVARRAVDGVVSAEVLGRSVPIRPIARASLFPTVTTNPKGFVVVDFATLFTLLNVDRPGVAPPSEAWFFRALAPSRDGLLERGPFRLQALVDLRRLRHARESDPLATGTKLILALTALAGALVGILGIVVFALNGVVAERRVFAEYEALGCSPRTLARLLVIRILAVAGTGLVCAAAGAAIAVTLIAALVAVGSGGERPLPPIEPTFAVVPAIGVLVAALGALTAIAVALARRMAREPTEARLRL